MSIKKQVITWLIMVGLCFGLIGLLLQLESGQREVQQKETKQGNILYQQVKAKNIKRSEFPVVTYELKASGKALLSNEKISSAVWKYEHYRMSDMNTYEISYLNKRHVRKVLFANAIEVHTKTVKKPTLSVYVQGNEMWNPILYIPMKP